MKKILATTAIILMTTSGAFAQGTDGQKPVEELNRALDNYLERGTNMDGVEETDMRPSQELIDKLNMAVKNSSDFMANQDCIAGTETKPSNQVTQDLAGTTTASDTKC